MNNIGERENQMGDNLETVNLGTNRKIVDLAVSDYHTAAILDDGTVKCWGHNTNGRLGYGDTDNRGFGIDHGTPSGRGLMGDNLATVDLGTGRTAVQIACDYNHTCVILDDGTVKCWGNNSNGQLGYGDTDNRGAGTDHGTPSGRGLMGDNLLPVDLGTGRTAVQIACGYDHTCVILDDGTVKCWGGNVYGQLGYGDTNNRGAGTDHGTPSGRGLMGDNLLPVDLGTGRTAVQISAKYDSTFVILDDGTVKSWGYNDYGHLGYGDTNNRGAGTDHGNPSGRGLMGDNLLPVDLGTGRTAVQILSGHVNTLVLLDDGTIKGWGYTGMGMTGATASNKGSTDELIGNEPNEIGDNLHHINLGSNIIKPLSIYKRQYGYSIIALYNSINTNTKTVGNREETDYYSINNSISNVYSFSGWLKINENINYISSLFPVLVNKKKTLIIEGKYTGLENKNYKIQLNGFVDDHSGISYNALSFNGTSDYINIPHAISTIKSVSIWFYPTSVSQQTLVYLNSTTYIEINGSSQINAQGFTSPTIYVNNSTSPSTLSINTWYHVVVTTATGITTDNPFFIGKGSSTFFTGSISDVRLFDTVITTTNIGNIYTSNTIIETEIAHYRLNGNTIKDISYQFNGTKSGSLVNASDHNGNADKALLFNTSSEKIQSLRVLNPIQSSSIKFKTGSSISNEFAFDMGKTKIYINDNKIRVYTFYYPTIYLNSSPDGSSISSAPVDATVTNNATINGTTAGPNQDFITGKSLIFNGSSDNVSIADVISGIKSIAIWFNPSSVSQQTILYLNSTTYIEINNSSQINAQGFTSPTIYVNNSTSPSTLSINNWYHVVVTTATGITTDNLFFIGKGSSTFFNGSISDVRFFNDVQSSSYVSSLYYNTDVLITSELAVYKFNDVGNYWGLFTNYATQQLSINNWYHLIVTINDINNNNILTPQLHNTGSIAIEKSIISDFRLYNSALTSTERTSIFNDNILGSEIIHLELNDGSANDSSLKSGKYNGIIYGNIGYRDDYFGIANRALYFNGSDNYVTIPNNPQINTIKSISLFIKPNSISQKTLVYLNSTTYIEINSSAQINAQGFTSPTIYVNNSASTTTLSTNTWYHIVITTTTNITTDNPFYIAKRNSDYFNGTISDFRLYAFVLVSSQITDIYTKGKLFGCELINYKLNKPAKNEVFDYSKTDSTKTYYDGTINCSPTTFKWSNDGGSSWENSSLSLSTSLISLENGLSARFISTSGYSVNDHWTFKGQSASEPIIYFNSNNYLYINGSNGSLTFASNQSAGTQQNLYVNGNLVAASNTGGDLTNSANSITASFNKNNKKITIDSQLQPVSHYKLDEGAGTTALDSSGNGNNGTLVNGPKYTSNQNGIYGKALDFDGINQYINVPNPSTDLSGTLTISMWFKRDTTNTHQTLISKDGTKELELYLGGYSGSTNLKFYHGDISIDGPLTSTFLPNIWYHLVITREGVTGLWTIKFYINGLFNTQGSTSTNPVASTNNIFIGAENDSNSLGNEDFDGKISDVRIYNQALTAEQVKQIYNNNLLSTNVTLNKDQLLYISDAVDSNNNGFKNITYSQNNKASNYETEITTNEYINDESNDKISVQLGRIEPEKWYHVVLTTTSPITTDNPFYFGKQSTNYFSGCIDDFRLYKKVLTLSEVKHLYNRQLSGNNLALHLPLSEPNNTSLDDKSIYQHTTTNHGVESGDIGPVGGSIKFNPFGALDFDGVDDYIDMGHISSLNFERTDSFALFSWINKADTSSGFIVGQYNNSTNKGYDMWALGGGEVRVHLRNTTSYAIRVESPGIISTDTWYYIGFTYDGSSSASGVKIYINGVLQSGTLSENNLTTGSIQSTDNKFMIGKRQNYSSYLFNGSISDVRIYNSALTAEQVKDIYFNQTILGTEVAHYKFNEKMGTTAFDSSGNGNNGTLTGGPTYYLSNPYRNYTMSFDGSNDKLGLSAYPNLFTFAGGFTFSTWILFKTINTTSGQNPNGYYPRLFEFTNSSGNDLVFHGGASGDADSDLRFNIGSPNYVTTTSNPLVINTWMHITLTVNNSSRNVIIYKNGVSILDTTIGGSYVEEARDISFIGNNNASDRGLHGDMADIRIYDYPLDAEEIYKIYKTGEVFGTEKLHYTFNQASGDQVLDQSGNGHLGKATNGPTYQKIENPNLGSYLTVDSAEKFNHSNGYLYPMYDISSKSHSFFCWMKLDNNYSSGKHSNCIFSKVLNKNYVDMALSLNNGKLEFETKFNDNIDSSIIELYPTFLPNQWYHIGYSINYETSIKNEKSGILKFYINGIMHTKYVAGDKRYTTSQNNSITTHNMQEFHNSKLYIGKRGDSSLSTFNDSTFRGSLSDIRFYETEITPIQARELFFNRNDGEIINTTHSNVSENKLLEKTFDGTNILIGHWKLGVGISKVVLDNSKDPTHRNNHGFLIGFDSKRVEGITGSVPVFDGTNDHVQITPSSAISTIKSIAFWIKPAAVTKNFDIYNI